MSLNGRRAADTALVGALASGQTLERAAGTAGVSKSTALRRMQEPDFRQRVEAAKAEALAQAVGRLTYASAAAAATLLHLMGGEHPASVRLRAAVGILDAVIKLRQQLELEERIAALEARMPTTGRHNGWR